MSNKVTVQNYLKEKGLSDKAIAGVMGNIQQESGFSTSATNSGSGAFGLFQWLGSRKDALYSFAKRKNENVTDVKTQMDFFWYELNTTEKKTKDVLTSNYSSASQYAEAFEETFERSGGSALQNRKTYAEAFYGEISSGGIVEEGTGTKTTTKTNKYGLTWWGDVVKVVLLLLLIIGGVVLFSVSFQSTVME